MYLATVKLGFDKAKTSARISYRKIAHPAPQDRINELDHPVNGLGLIPAKNLLQLSHQCCALLQPGGIPRPPGSLAAPHPSKVEAQEAKTLSLGQIDDSAFLLINGDLEIGPAGASEHICSAAHIRSNAPAGPECSVSCMCQLLAVSRRG